MDELTVNEKLAVAKLIVLNKELDRLHESYKETLKSEKDTIPIARHKSASILERINELNKIIMGG